jgi:hypothetical protein
MTSAATQSTQRAAAAITCQCVLQTAHTPACQLTAAAAHSLVMIAGVPLRTFRLLQADQVAGRVHVLQQQRQQKQQRAILTMRQTCTPVLLTTLHSASTQWIPQLQQLLQQLHTGRRLLLQLLLPQQLASSRQAVRSRLLQRLLQLLQRCAARKLLQQLQRGTT